MIDIKIVNKPELALGKNNLNGKYVFLTFDAIMNSIEKFWESCKGINFDAIVSIGRGGNVPATALSYISKIPLYIIDGSGKSTLKSKNILLVDDIIFSGATLNNVIRELSKNNCISMIYIIAGDFKKIKQFFGSDGLIPTHISYYSDFWLNLPWERNPDKDYAVCN